MSDTKVRHLEILENGVYTPCEVAALLKVEMSTLYPLIRDGKIPSFVLDPDKKRPRKLVKGSDLLIWIENNKN